MNNPERDHARALFLSEHGWGDADVEALPSDASFRRYFRLANGERFALLMDAPPDSENTSAFVSIARHLNTLGLSAPRIEAANETQGFAVIEDFGADTYTRLLASGADEVPLYELAVDVLRHLHGHPQTTAIDLPPYGHDLLIEKSSLLIDWYLPAVSGQKTTPELRASFRQAWMDVFEPLPAFEPTIVLRDYHVDNLMILPDREGVARCGILDFQDALTGHPTYDLMSLLEDARRDISDDLTQAMLERYGNTTTDNNFMTWYTVLGFQRHARLVGLFVRLCVSDGKPTYLAFMPRVMRLLVRNLNAPALEPMKDWFDHHIPNLLDPLPDFDPAQVRKLIY